MKNVLLLIAALFLIIGATGVCAMLALKQYGPVCSSTLALFTSTAIERKVPNANSKIEKACISLNDNYGLSVTLLNVVLTYQNLKISLPTIGITANIMDVISGNWLQSVEQLHLSLSSDIAIDYNHNPQSIKKQKKHLTDWVTSLKKYIHKNTEFIEAVESLLRKAELKLKLSEGDNKEITLAFNQIAISQQKEALTDNAYLKLEGDLDAEGALSKVSFIIKEENNNVITFTGNIQSIPLKMLSIYTNYFRHHDENQDHLTCNLKIDGTINHLGFTQLDFNLNSAGGVIKADDFSSHDIALQESVIFGTWSPVSDTLSLDLAIKTEDINIVGVLQRVQNKITGSFKSNSFDLQALLKHWPNSKLSETKKWIATHVKAGTVQAVELLINTEQNSLKNLPRDAILVNITASNCDVHYLNQMPESQDLKVNRGTVQVSAEDVVIKLYDAYVVNSKTQNFKCTIKYKQQEKLLELAGNVVGPVQDVVDYGFLLGKKKNDVFINFKGTAETTIQMRIPLQSAFIMNSNNTQITTNVKALSNRNLFGSFSLREFKARAKLLGNALEINGIGRLNNAFTTNLKVNFDVLDPSQIKIFAGLQTHTRDLLQHQFIESDWAHGNIATDFEMIIENAHRYEVRSKTNLDLLEIAHPIGLYKDHTKPGNLIAHFSGTIGNPLHKISFYNLELPHFKTSGTGFLHNAFGIMSLKSEKSSLLNSHFSFDYQNNEMNEKKLFIYGDKIDLSQMKLIPLLKVRNHSKAGSFKLKTNINNLILHEGQMLFHPKIDINCNLGGCDDLQLSGWFHDNSKINVFFSYPVIAITTDAADKVLSAFGLYKNMTNGILEFKGKFEDRNTFKGNLSISDYYITTNSALAGLLITLSTLQAIPDFHKKGVPFQVLNSGIVFSNEKCYLDHFVMSGSAFDIRGSGVIYKNLNIAGEGVIIPSNIINKAAKSIPILRRMLSGANDSGVIATNFSIGGNVNNLQFIVNPLSILMPGFLGDIFDREQSFRAREGFIE